jgi:hypothetical protein
MAALPAAVAAMMLRRDSRFVMLSPKKFTMRLAVYK